MNSKNADLLEFIVDEYSDEFIKTGARKDGLFGAPFSKSSLFTKKILSMELLNKFSVL